MLSKQHHIICMASLFSKIKHVSTHHNKPQILITTYCYKTELELFCEDNSKSLTQPQSNKTLSRPEVPSPWPISSPCETSFAGNSETLERKRNGTPNKEGYRC